MKYESAINAGVEFRIVCGTDCGDLFCKDARKLNKQWKMRSPSDLLLRKNNCECLLKFKAANENCSGPIKRENSKHARQK